MIGALQVTVDNASINEIRAALGDMQRHLPRHLATAVNRVAKSCKKEAAKRVGAVINLGLDKSIKDINKPFKKAQTLKKTIRQKGKASASNPSVTVTLWGGYAFPMKYFQAQHYDKKGSSGVRVKYRKGGGWVALPGAFQVNRYSGHVYKRQGTSRKAGRHLVGKSPADFFEETGTPEAVYRIAKQRLPIEIKRRIRELTLQAQGRIKLKASRTRS